MRMMFKVSLATALSASTVLSPFTAYAGSAKAAKQFHELLRSAVPAEMASAEKMPFVHMVPDEDVLAASSADSIDSAIESLKKSSLPKLIVRTQKHEKEISGDVSALNADKILAIRPITIVIVPGIFGEFIDTRGFEDVLSLPSSDSDSFKAAVGKALAENNPNASDRTYNTQTREMGVLPLTEVINVGNMRSKAGEPIARVVLLKTPRFSLETMGEADDHADLFNRRISKYLALTGPQDLALVGYSRGTVLALEMLAQAKIKNLPWLSSVKGMISLGGVAWGSTLADDTANPNSATFKAIQHVQKLRASLNPESPIATFKAWGVFFAQMALIVPELLKHNLVVDSADYKVSLVNSGVDIKTMLGIIYGFVVEAFQSTDPLKLVTTIRQDSKFSSNVTRFQALLDSVLAGVGTLTSNSRLEWWKTHTLPTNVRYYSLSGAMARPDASDLEKDAWSKGVGYNSSVDDKNLLQNRLDYEDKSGITLNDSQVSVAQTMILPNAAAKMNPANAGLNDSYLGTVGTHHWGLALRVVTPMADGEMNPFPREALLKALAAKVAMDEKK
jgi:hypothetical protein